MNLRQTRRIALKNPSEAELAQALEDLGQNPHRGMIDVYPIEFNGSMEEMFQVIGQGKDKVDFAAIRAIPLEHLQKMYLLRCVSLDHEMETSGKFRDDLTYWEKRAADLEGALKKTNAILKDLHEDNYATINSRS